MNISGISNQTQTAAGTANNGDLSMQTFMMLLTVQLTNQNPLEPMNDRDFFAQMAQLGTVNGLTKLQSGIDDVNAGIYGLGSTMEMVRASEMIGKSVTADRPGATGESDKTIKGEVTGVFVKDGRIFLNVKEGENLVEVPLVNVKQVNKI